MGNIGRSECTIKTKRKKRWLFLAFFLFLTVRPGFAASGAGPGEDDVWYFLYSSKYTYEEMEADLNHMEEKYGDLVKKESLAGTADGREVYHVMVGNEQAENHVLVTASIHAREYISSQLVMRQLEDLLRQSGNGENAGADGVSVQELVRNTAVHFVPMVNPDGVSLCQNGLDGLKLSQTRDTVAHIYELDGGTDWNRYLCSWKANAMGVDLNRNFDAKWELYDDGKGHISSDRYKGTSAGSEAETKALVQLTGQYPFKRTISYHTQGNVIYWYFGQSGELEAESRNFAELAAGQTGYRIDGAYENLDPAGYKDWAVSRMQIPSLTIEVGTGASPVDPGQFPAIWEQNVNVIPAVLSSLYMHEEQGTDNGNGSESGGYLNGPGFY